MNHKQQTFITGYLRHRSAFTAYCLAYNVKDASNYDSIMSAANRLLNHPEVNAVITSVLDGIRHEVEQELRTEMKTDVLTIQRKRELLAKIATGETYAVQNYKGKDCNMCVQHVWPTINQMLKAIDLDNKMVGLYSVYNRQSAKSQQITTNSGIKDNKSPLQGDRGTLEQGNPEKNTQIGNKTQQFDPSSHYASPLQGDRGTLAQNNPEKNIQIGNKTQQFDRSNDHDSPPKAEDRSKTPYLYPTNQQLWQKH